MLAYNVNQCSIDRYNDKIEKYVIAYDKISQLSVQNENDTVEDRLILYNNMFQLPESDTLPRGNPDLLTQHATELEPPPFRDEEDSPPTITVQPYTNDESTETRRPIPISTIDWRSTNDMQLIAGEGVDFLRGVDQLYIQQTVELSDLMANVESENRYTVRVPHGETIYYAMETSNETQRMCCGSNRAFIMRLFDQTQQEALVLKRSLACGMCNLWCARQSLDVFLPRDQYLGRIVQEFSFSVPSFIILNNYGIATYRLEGPASWNCFTSSKESHFKIYSGDGLTQLGSINHIWDQVNSSYNLLVQFPNRQDDPKNKALLLGAAFLLEYMYFVVAKKSRFLCC